MKILIVKLKLQNCHENFNHEEGRSYYKNLSHAESFKTLGFPYCKNLNHSKLKTLRNLLFISIDFKYNYFVEKWKRICGK